VVSLKLLQVRIREERINKELNQPQLAKIMKVTKQTVSNLCRQYFNLFLSFTKTHLNKLILR
jgi:DNA-binding XRE family transcriptional regulator